MTIIKVHVYSGQFQNDEENLKKKKRNHEIITRVTESYFDMTTQLYYIRLNLSQSLSLCLPMATHIVLFAVMS